MKTSAFDRMVNVVSYWYTALTKHYAIQPVEHVGSFAGSLLERSSWDH